MVPVGKKFQQKEARYDRPRRLMAPESIFFAVICQDRIIS